MRRAPIFLLAAALAAGGCVERTMTVETNPPQALAYINDEEAGRTPFNHRFVWYGTYEIEVRKEGYQTLKTTAPVIAPWWQWVPFDLIAELLPLHLEDSHTLHYTLQPIQPGKEAPDELIDRAQRLRARLEFGKEGPQTKPATTQPTKRATTRPARKHSGG
jgi:hypothetical protein